LLTKSFVAESIGLSVWLEFGHRGITHAPLMLASPADNVCSAVYHDIWDFSGRVLAAASVWRQPRWEARILGHRAGPIVSEHHRACTVSVDNSILYQVNGTLDQWLSFLTLRD
jgi:hypothetical protein